MNDEDCFSDLHPTLRYVLASWMQWEDLRTIQKKTLQAFQKGSDLLILSPTAGGKSEAAFIPVLDQIIKNGYSKPVCLYVAPLKALINDMAGRLEYILSPLHLDLIVRHGDAPPGKLPECPVILLTTPETLMVLLYKRDTSWASSIRYCIIDELHVLASSMRGSQVIAALNRIETLNSCNIIRIGLSATVGNPGEVLEWLRGDQIGVQVSGDKNPHDILFTIYKGQKSDTATTLSRILAGKRALVFSGSRKEAETLASSLRMITPDVFVHHSSLSSEIKRKTEEITHQGYPFIVICTSTLELGIDIGDLDLVVQTGPPRSISSFLQRLGRTGRRGTLPVMYLFSATSEETCHILSAIQGAREGLVEPVIIPRYPYELLAREILLSVLTRDRVSKKAFDAFLLSKPYQNISQDRLHELIRHLVTHDWLYEDGDVLIPGSLAEIARKNPGFLYSVIAGQESIPVTSHEGECIGTIPGRPSKDAPFILGGVSWQQMDQDEYSPLVVRPAAGDAVPPAWKGAPEPVSQLILSGIRSLASGMLPPFPLPDAVLSDVTAFRDTFPPGIPDNSLSVRYRDGKTVLYTFLGKTWNQVIGAYFERNLSVPYRGSDHYSVTFSDEIPLPLIRKGVEMIKNGSWEDLMEEGIPVQGDHHNSPLLPISCFREQWGVDFMQLPLLIETVKSLKTG